MTASGRVEGRRAANRTGFSLVVAVICLTPALTVVAETSEAEPLPVSFQNDVMAVISKAGCNAGACHGNKTGKGGFKLSLRGEDPAGDFNVLTRDVFARRTNALEPDQSLILLKATTQLPHEGGLRFKPDSDEYQTLRRWIAAGLPRDGATTPVLQKLEVTPGQQVLTAPADRVQISAVAVFSDGSRRDVTRIAVYEQSSELAEVTYGGLVKRKDRDGETTVIVRYLNAQQPVRVTFVPARPDFAWAGPAPANYIDEHVFAKLRTLRTNPSEPATDAEFARRAYLDLLGVLPTADEARAFVADTSPDKRGRLVDRLLARPEYAEFWALKWADVLRVEERPLDRKGVTAMHRWLRQAVAENKPLDAFVRELVAARGSTYANPPANYYRALRDPVSRGEATAQLFMGVRLQCAQCHNHPFDRWTMDDYYGWAGVFGRVSYKVLENRRRDTNDGHEFIGEQVVYESREGGLKDPRTGRNAEPRFLGEGTLSVDEEQESRLDALADWLTSERNPYFAQSQVNRIWYHLMGRGIVDPVDDFRATNPPSHPELLDALAADFVKSGYDTNRLIRLVMASRTYGLSSEPNDTNRGDGINYSHVLPRRLSAEQLLDAQHGAAGVPSEFAGYPRGTRAGQIAGVQAVGRRGRGGGGGPTEADRFLVSFGKPPRLLSCDCERSNETTLGQAFQLISGPQITRLVSHPENRLAKLIAEGKTDEQIIDDVYWSTLTRPPTDDEAKAMAGHVKSVKDRRQGLEDVMWALLNAKEFVLRK